MSSAIIYINGEDIEFMGNVTDKFLPYTNTNEVSRSGKVYTTTEAAVRTVTVENLMFEIAAYAEFKTFIAQCGSKKFNVSMVFDEDCAADLANGNKTVHYTGCVLQGEPEYSYFERKITGFEFAYSDVVTHIGL